MDASTDDVRRARFYSSFIPLVLVLFSVLTWTVFQTEELVSGRHAIDELRSSQTAALEQAYTLRRAADSLATKTQKLADTGNSNAREMVERLRQRGVTINLSASAMAPPP